MNCFSFLIFVASWLPSIIVLPWEEDQKIHHEDTKGTKKSKGKS
jgi:hypothetical protein